MAEVRFCTHPGGEAEVGPGNAGVVVGEVLKSAFWVLRAVFFLIEGLIKKAGDEMLWPAPRGLREKT